VPVVGGRKSQGGALTTRRFFGTNQSSRLHWPDGSASPPQPCSSWRSCRSSLNLAFDPLDPGAPAGSQCRRRANHRVMKRPAILDLFVAEPKGPLERPNRIPDRQKAVFGEQPIAPLDAAVAGRGPLFVVAQRFLTQTTAAASTTDLQCRPPYRPAGRSSSTRLFHKGGLST